MALDFYIHLDCKVQALRKPRLFMRDAKVWKIFENAMHESKRLGLQDSQAQEMELNTPFPINTMLGEKSRVTVRQLYSSWSHIESKTAPICAHCPVNSRGRALGCFGSIPIPVSLQGEKWLMDRFDPPHGDLGFLPIRFKTGRLDGKSVDQTRTRKPSVAAKGIVMAPDPVRKQLTPDGPYYSSSQLIELLLKLGTTIDGSILLELLSDFRVIEGTPDQLSGLAVTVNMREMDQSSFAGDWTQLFSRDYPLNISYSPDDDPSILGFKELFKACWFALRHQATVVMIEKA